MKVMSFNINGLRARLHQLSEITLQQKPDILCLQEIKVADEQFPLSAITELGYECVHHGQKGHYGVATLARRPFQTVSKGFPDEASDHQRRMLITTHPLVNGQTLTLLNGYFPQGENRNHAIKFPLKVSFYARLQQWLKDHADPRQPLIVLGDFNVAPQDTDIGIGAPNQKRWLRDGKCAFLPEERAWYEQLLNWGLADLYRLHEPPNETTYSWYDYRSRGFEDNPKRGLRIDHILGTQPVQQRCFATGIDLQIRSMEKPSDHAPVWAELHDDWD